MRTKGGTQDFTTASLVLQGSCPTDPLDSSLSTVTLNDEL